MVPPVPPPPPYTVYGCFGSMLIFGLPDCCGYAYDGNGENVGRASDRFWLMPAARRRFCGSDAVAVAVAAAAAPSPPPNDKDDNDVDPSLGTVGIV